MPFLAQRHQTDGTGSVKERKARNIFFPDPYLQCHKTRLHTPVLSVQFPFAFFRLPHIHLEAFIVALHVPK